MLKINGVPYPTGGKTHTGTAKVVVMGEKVLPEETPTENVVDKENPALMVSQDKGIISKNNSVTGNEITKNEGKSSEKRPFLRLSLVQSIMLIFSGVGVAATVMYLGSKKEETPTAAVTPPAPQIIYVAPQAAPMPMNASGVVMAQEAIAPNANVAPIVIQPAVPTVQNGQPSQPTQQAAEHGEQAQMTAAASAVMAEVVEEVTEEVIENAPTVAAVAAAKVKAHAAERTQKKAEQVKQQAVAKNTASRDVAQSKTTNGNKANANTHAQAKNNAVNTKAQNAPKANSIVSNSKLPVTKSSPNLKGIGMIDPRADSLAMRQRMQQGQTARQQVVRQQPQQIVMQPTTVYPTTVQPTRTVTRQAVQQPAVQESVGSGGGTMLVNQAYLAKKERERQAKEQKAQQAAQAVTKSAPRAATTSKQQEYLADTSDDLGATQQPIKKCSPFKTRSECSQ